MINPKDFYNSLQREGIKFFTGVPDSLLKDFCAYVTDNTPEYNNVIAANEGNAIALASGHYLATTNPGMVYMQNSGLGNCINPLTSLADSEVYSIPMLLLIGWRAEPNVKDEPQHAKMGKIMLGMLDNLQIPYSILEDNYEPIIKKAFDYMEKNKAPYALVAKKGSFENYSLKKNIKTNFGLNREDALQAALELMDEEDITVSTTGKTSRELFEIREKHKHGHHKDFLTVGSMGHSSSIALGIALAKPNRKIYCFDGDGALIMHMGVLSTIGSLKPKNFMHIVFNNFAHDSVGGQPTAASFIDIPTIAKANGYKEAFSAKTKEEVSEIFQKIKKIQGPILLEIKVDKGSREDLGRPTKTPIENKNDFMKFLKE